MSEKIYGNKLFIGGTLTGTRAVDHKDVQSISLQRKERDGGMIHWQLKQVRTKPYLTGQVNSEQAGYMIRTIH